ncbi:GNAT family N-acetyltransferase [Ferruginibacter profundus]
MELIPYKEEHREQMISVWERSVRATHHFVNSKEVDRLKELVKQIDFNSFSVYCLIAGDKVVGFLGVEDYVIESLFLDPDYIGQKLGTMLINFAINELKAHKVNVNEQNTEAIKFYAKFGFVVYERTAKDDYGNDYPILKMTLKPKVLIRNAYQDEQIPYDLLLLSDDTIEAIDKSLNNGELFVAEINNKVIAAFILKIIGKDTIEIKNIAVSEDQQGTGIGTILLQHIISVATQRDFKNLTVGTCDLCSKEIQFYKKSGFTVTDIRKNFFIDNYKNPIYENGMQIKDMVMLSIDLSSKMAN